MSDQKTRNVLDLVKAAIKRQDDLRVIAVAAERDYTDTHLARVDSRWEASIAAKRHADGLVEAEKERSAEVLRTHLEATIQNVYAQLSQHIAEQIKQINAAMHAASELARARDESVKDSLQASLTAAREGADKLERNNEKRFEAINEFRASLTDQASRFMPREVSEAATDAARREREALHGEVVVLRDAFNSHLAEAGSQDAYRHQRNERGLNQATIMVAVITAISVLVSIAAVILAIRPR